MQDLFAEAGLSSGAVYLQFKSKDELILAIAEDNMANVFDILQAAARHSSDDNDAAPSTLGATLARAIRDLHSSGSYDDLAALAVQVWAEATINPAVNDGMAILISRLRAEIAVIITTDAADPGTVDAIAGIVVSTMAGLLMQRALIGPAALDLDLDVLQATFPQPTRTDGPFRSELGG